VAHCRFQARRRLRAFSNELDSVRLAHCALTKALVYDTQLASQVFAFQNSAEDVGVFQVTIVPRPEHTLTELEAAVDQVIQKFLAKAQLPKSYKKRRAGSSSTSCAVSNQISARQIN
jgi:23S rRNA A1618 N6-methylase RlmF